jgi:transcriptional regulator with XRE-family HTH domain
MDFDRAGFDRQVGLRLQLARKEQRMTQQELARRIGLPRPSYANIESGRQRIALDVVWRAAVALGVPLAVLVPEAVARGHGAPPVMTTSRPSIAGGLTNALAFEPLAVDPGLIPILKGTISE